MRLTAATAGTRSSTPGAPSMPLSSRQLLRLRGWSYSHSILAITAAALAGRLLAIDREPLWRDEAFTAIVQRRSFGGMIDAVAHDSAPPLSYVLNHPIALLSTSPATLRLLSTLAGTVAVPLTAALGRRVGGDRGGVWAAAACAVAPAMVVSSRDARPYALATTLVLATVLTLWRALERPSSLRWLLYGCTAVLALYTEYFAAFAIAAQLCAAAIVLRPPPRRLLCAGVAAAAATALLAPWIVVARAQLGHASNPFWVQPVGVPTLGGVFVQFFSGPPIDRGVPAKLQLQAAQGVAVGAGVLAAYVLYRCRAALEGSGRRAALFLAGCGLGAIALLVIVSIWHPLVEARYASVLWGPLVVLIGVGMALFRPKLGAKLVLVVLAATSIVLSLVPVRSDTPAAVADLHEAVGANDLVAATPSTYLLLLYYSGFGSEHHAATLLASHTHIIATHVDWFWGTAAYPPGAVLPSVPGDVVATSGRIYYVTDDPTTGFDNVPRGYRLTAASCHRLICVAEYGKGRVPSG